MKIQAEAALREGNEAPLQAFGACALATRNDLHMAGFAVIKASLALKKNQLDSALHYVQLALDKGKAVNQPEIYGKALMCEAILFDKQGKIAESIRAYQALITRCAQAQLPEMETKAIYNLANLYDKHLMLNQALSYFGRGIQLASSHQLHQQAGEFLILAGNILRYLDSLQEAIDCFTRASEAFRRAGNQRKYQEAIISLNEARMAAGHPARPDTLQAFLTETDLGGGLVTRIAMRVHLANLWLSKAQLYRAKCLTDEAMNLATKNDISASLPEIYQLYADYYTRIGDHLQASEWLRKSLKLAANVTDENNRAQIRALTALYDLDTKEKQIALLERDQRITLLWTAGFAIVALFAVLLVLVLRSFFRTRLRLGKAELRSHQLEAEQARLQNVQLANDLQHRSRELMGATMNIVHRNALIEQLQAQLKPLAETRSLQPELRSHLTEIARNLSEQQLQEKDWSVFQLHFSGVHPSFFERLTTAFPDLSQNELRQCAYVRLGLSRKEIALLQNVSAEAVKMARYRLKKKLNLTHEDEIAVFLAKFE